MKTVAYDKLNHVQQAALDAAEQSLKNAYNPYSQFAVGAALITHDDKVICGSNFENAAYGSTICAERAAVLSANSQGIWSFKGMAIIGRGKKPDPKRVTAPCGSCRQVLFEVAQRAERDLELILSSSDKSTIKIAKIKELLPLGFGPDDIGGKISKFRK